ncbi:MAG: alpha-N-arabinofuranosidase [Bacilli bacterium]|nr:alpha-N-arabinofuranosidase [Bacilli bacterium]
MRNYRLFLSRSLDIGKMEDTMFSSFIEHLGRAVYGGIYLPGHPTADEDGFRNDVADVLRPLNLNLIRYPGGNFVSGYFWEDGIGPKENRPTKKEEAWKSIETNEVGTDEFMKWIKKVGSHTMMAVNLGSGTTESARNLVEYCNGDGNGKYATLRRKYGSEKPYAIKYWGLGNEMDGDWQIGHLPAEEYVVKAKEAARKMKEVDPNIKFIACGSSSIDMATFPEWDRIVMDGLYDEVDYLSIHQYFFQSTTEDDFYASYLAMDKYIDTFRGLLTYLQTKHRHSKPFYLCFDEYNVWYNIGEMPEDYVVAPHLLEEHQSMKDVLVFGGLLNALVNNCDVVKIACLAQLVNVIAPVLTENDGGVLLNGIYYPFSNYCHYMRGMAKKIAVLSGDTFPSRFGDAHYISSCAVESDGVLNIQIVNYAKEETEVNLALEGYDDLEFISHEVLANEDLDARNTFEKPDAIAPKEAKGQVKLSKGHMDIALGKSSYNLIRLKVK